MAELFPNPKLQFTTATGAPAVGWKLYTYAAGTSTALATYTDGTGATPNANPIIMDARGECTAYGNANYKFILRDNLDNLIWTQDNVEDVGTGSYSALQSSVGSSLIGYIAAVPNAVATTVQSKLREVVSIFDYFTAAEIAAVIAGAFATDVTAKIQLAFNDLGTTKELYFPNGGYRLSAKLVIPAAAGWRIRGQSRNGARLKQFTANTRIFSLEAEGTHSWTIESLTFEWNAAQPSTNTQAIAIFMGTGVASPGGFYHWRVHDCTFAKGFRAIAGDATNSPAVWGCDIRNNFYELDMSGAFFFAEPNPVIGQPRICIENNLIKATASAEAPIRITSGDTITIAGNEFLGGTSAINLVTISSSSVLFRENKSEAYAAGAAGTPTIFNFPNSNVTAIANSVIAVSGSGATVRAFLVATGTGSKLTLIGFDGTANMTGGAALVYQADSISFVSGVRLNVVGTGHFRDDVRSFFGTVPVPGLDADKRQSDYFTLVGDASVTLTAASDRYQLFTTALTANRTCTLPTPTYIGMEFEIRRIAAGAFTLQVTDPVSGVNFIFPAGATGYVRYRAASTGQYRIINSNFDTFPATTTEVLTGTATDRVVTADALAALWEQGTDVASAGTISLGEGGYFNVTGTTTITDIDFATDKAGRPAKVKFAGALTLTHSGTTLILPTGANIITAAGDTAIFVSEGSDAVRCISYQKASGAPLLFGHAVGDGGTITQITSRTTGVTLNELSGEITLVSAAGLATYQSFTVTNSTVLATDRIVVNQKSGTDLYITLVTNIVANSFRISYATTGGVTTEQPVLVFNITRGAAT